MNSQQDAQPERKQLILAMQFPRDLLSKQVRLFENTRHYTKSTDLERRIFSVDVSIFLCRIIALVVCICTYKCLALNHIISVYCLCNLLGNIVLAKCQSYVVILIPFLLLTFSNNSYILQLKRHGHEFGQKSFCDFNINNASERHLKRQPKYNCHFLSYKLVTAHEILCKQGLCLHSKR